MPPETSESLIFIDDLTGFFNRRYLYAQLPKEVETAKAANQNLWVLMMDIDNFKLVNDTYGHLSGDQLIKDVASALKANTKIDDKRIRYAGDEFTFVLPNIDPKDILAVAGRIVKKVDSLKFKELSSGKEMHITLSVGIAGFPQDSSDAVQLVNLADKSLYISKQKGKNCVSVVSEITPDLLWKKDMLERFPCAKMIDREKELVLLKEAFLKAKQFQASLVLFSGPLGIGKTRLLHEFEKSLQNEDIICLSGRGSEKTTTQPYGVLIDAFDLYLGALGKIPEGVLEGIKESDVALLATALPSLREFTRGKTVNAEAKLDLKEAFFKLLVNLAKEKPVCLLLDELHFADQQSLEVISGLLQQNKLLPILVAGAYLEGVREPLAAGSGDFKLEGLDFDNCELMVSQIFSDITLDENFFNLIYKVTKGNPLFIEELLKYCAENEFVFYKEGRWQKKELSVSDLPASIEQVIEIRLEALNPEIKEMIAKAAAIGENFQLDLLRRIDSEDRGYVMDLIETAKKLGLIYEKGKDEFVFATGQMRDILFKMVGKERKKLFYSHLAEAIEKLYADQLGNVAGELYDAFKNAEDEKRAEQYAQIIREGKAILQTQKAQYARELLKQAELEKLLVPLSREVWIIVPELIRAMYIAAVNHLLYPPQNRMRVESLEDIYNKLSRIFQEVELLNISSIEGAIFVNKKKVGRELAVFFADSFMNIFANLNIESITFSRGVGLEELDVFVGVLNKPEAGQENLAQKLFQQGVTHIQINEVTFISSRQKTRQKEGFRDTMLMDYLLGDMPLEEAAKAKADLPQEISRRSDEIARILEKLGDQVSSAQKTEKDKQIVKADVISKSIQKLSKEFQEQDAQKWPEYKAAIVKTILAMEPGMRAEVFLSQPEAGEEEKDKKDLIQEIFLDLPDNAVAETVVAEYSRKDADVKKVRSLVQRLLATPEKKEKLTGLLKEKLKSAGASNEECSWIFAENLRESIFLSSEEKIRKITQSSGEVLLKILPMINLDELLRELLSKNLSTETEKIEDKIVSLARRQGADVATVGRYLEEVLALYLQYSPDIFLPQFIEKLLRECRKNTEFPAVFCSITAPYLDKLSQVFLKSGQNILVEEIIKVYITDPRRRQEYFAVLDTLSERLTDELIQRIESGMEWHSLSGIALLLKEKSAKRLFEKALFESGVQAGRYFEAYLARRAVGKILGQLPKAEIFDLIGQERFARASLETTWNLIEVIAAMENEEVVNILEIPLKSGDFMVRKKVIFSLSKMKGQNSAQLLGLALHDENEELRNEALNALRNRKDEPAKEVLATFQKQKS